MKDHVVEFLNNWEIERFDGNSLQIFIDVGKTQITLSVPFHELHTSIEDLISLNEG